MTAIHYAFLAPDAPLPGRKSQFVYFANVERFMREEYDLAFGYDMLSRYWKRVLANREVQFANHIFPLQVIGAGTWDLPNWVQGYEQHWVAKADKAA